MTLITRQRLTKILKIAKNYDETKVYKERKPHNNGSGNVSLGTTGKKLTIKHERAEEERSQQRGQRTETSVHCGFCAMSTTGDYEMGAIV